MDEVIERGTVDSEVFKDGEGACAEGFDGDGGTVFEFAHIELAGGTDTVAVGDTVDGEAAHTADPFTAVVIEGDGFFVSFDEVFVDDIEHFQEGGFGGDVFGFVADEFAWGVWVILAPDLELEVHGKWLLVWCFG